MRRAGIELADHPRQEVDLRGRAGRLAIRLVVDATVLPEPTRAGGVGQRVRGSAPGRGWPVCGSDAGITRSRPRSRRLAASRA